MRLPICISIAAIILLVDAVKAFKALRKGTLFSNIIKSGIVFGLPVLLAGCIALLGVLDIGGKVPASDPDDSNNGWRGDSSIIDSSPIDSSSMDDSQSEYSQPDDSQSDDSQSDDSQQDVNEHQHDYKQVFTEPTCTQQGYTLYSCSCGDWYKNDYVKATGHTYEAESVIEPTCTQQGYTLYSCSCGDTYNGSYVAEVGHTYEVESVIEPTCTKGGYTKYICYCGDKTEGNYTEKADHDYEVTRVIEPTCTEQGYTIYTCGCGASYNGNYVGVIDHTYDHETVIEPTCTERGYTIYTCDCGASYNGNYVSVIPHDYDTSVIEPTCTEQGYTIYTCDCGDWYNGNYVSVIPHSYDNEKLIEPTCKDEGYTEHSCVCGASYKDSYVDPTGKHVANLDGLCKYCEIIIYTSGLSYTVSLDGTYATVTGYNGSSKEVVIASTYNGVPVTVIGENAFENSKLTNVIIPKSITTIETYAFLNCYSLTSVVIPKSVTSIGKGAFYCCESLSSVTMLVSEATIEDFAFAYCAALTSVYIESIADWCKINFKSAEANPWSVKEENNTHGEKCLYLNKEENGEIVSELITELVIPEGVTNINDYAFYGCESLTRVEIPASVTSIGRQAFENCASLSSLVFKDTSTWYRTDSYANWTNTTGGTRTSVNYASTAATYFKSTYKDHYWYKL